MRKKLFSKRITACALAFALAFQPIAGIPVNSMTVVEAAENEVIVDPNVDLSGLVAGDPETYVNGWGAWTNAGITADGGPNSTVTFTYPSGKCANDYALQFQTEENLSITQGEYYTLSFTVQSSIPRYIEVCMGDTQANYARYNDLVYKLPANQNTDITYVFAATATVDGSDPENLGAKLQFLLGTNADDKSPFWANEDGHTLTFSNVSLTKAGSAETAGANIEVATNKEALSVLVDECEKLSAEDYKEDTYAVLEAAVETATTVENNATATQKQVDEALTDLQIAKASLLAADYVPPADPETKAAPINFEDANFETYRAQDNGNWGGDSNVVFDYDGTTATVSADSFGWNEWAVQWKLKDVSSLVTNNVFSFDVVSTINKRIVVKNETTGSSTNLELKAGETKHFAERVTGTALNYTFDLSGGTGAGELTFTNMRFGEEYVPYNFEDNSDNVGWHAGDWAGAVATGTPSGTSYTMDVTDFGNNAWGVQLMLNNFLNLAPGYLYEIHATVESSVDKDIILKLGNPTNEDASYAYKEVSLVGGAEPQEITLKTTEQKDEVENTTLYFAVGNGQGTSGKITVSDVYVVAQPLGLKDAPVLAANKLSKDNGYVVGAENPVIGFTDDADWRTAVTAVKVNNHTLDADEYAFSEGALTLDKSIFTKQNVYTVEVEAEGYGVTSTKLPIYATTIANEDWELEWSDEFNGTELDPEKWDYEIGIQSGEDGKSSSPTYWGNNEKQYYTKEALTFEDGKMVITANAITDADRQKYNITDTTVKYTSSRIRTVSEDGSNTLFATTYGRVEAMMELPEGNGYWPAFWMLPTNETIDIYGTWATSGELDIMEAVGQNNNYVNGTIHYGSVWPNNVYHGGTHYFPEGQSTGGAHEYAIEWEPGEIRWYVDDVLYHVENNWYAIAPGAAENYAFPAPFDEDFYILFNLAMSGNYVSNVEPGADELGKSMKVDYVRVWKDKSADYDKEVSAPDIDKDTEFFEAQKVNADATGNYVKDSEFTTLESNILPGGGSLGGTVIPELGKWYAAIDTSTGAKANVDVVENDGVKYGQIDVTGTGANNYDIQLLQHVPLAKGYSYKLTFDAYTTQESGRNFSVAPKGDADNSWAGYDSGIVADLTTTPKSFEHVFTMNNDSDPTARIEMNIGGTTGDVCIGNVRLVALSDEEVEEIENEKLNGPKEPLENGEHIYNGTFDLGSGKFAYWNKTDNYKVSTANRTMKATINSSTKIDDTTLSQPGIQLLATDTYKVSLDAKAAANKEIKVGLYSAKGTAYHEIRQTISTENSKVEFEFTMPDGVSDENAVFIVAFGGNATSVEIDNISMKRTTDNNVDYSDVVRNPVTADSVWTIFKRVDGYDQVISDSAQGEITADVFNSTENWHSMLFTPAPVTKGIEYTITFDAKGSVANTFALAVQEDDTNNLAMTENYVFDVATAWNTYTCTFKSALTGGNAIKLKYLLSGSDVETGTITVRNVTMQAVIDDTEKPVNAAKPFITKQPTDVQCKPEENAELSVEATVADEGTMSYQWYVSESATGENAEVITGATAATYSPDTTAISSRYYYCEVKNTNNADTITGEEVAVTSSSIVEVKVCIPVESITLNSNTLELVMGDTATLTTTITPNDATDTTIYWTSSDETVATVADGIVTAVAPGTATITAQAGAEITTCVVTVSAKQVPENTVSGSTDYVAGENYVIRLTDGEWKTAFLAGIEDGNASITINNKTLSNIAGMVNTENGEITIPADKMVAVDGKCTIAVVVEGYESIVLNVNSTTGVPGDVTVTGVILDATAIELEVGGTSILTATVAPETATNKDVTWTTSNAEVATVAGGTVTAVAPGEATITAKAGDQTATCTVTVKAKNDDADNQGDNSNKPVAVTSVTLDKTTVELEVGGTSKLAATVAPENATNKDVTWTTSDAAVATVVDGTVTALKEGTVTITATADGKTATCTVTIKAKKVDETEKPGAEPEKPGEDTNNPVAVTDVTLDVATAELKIGETKKIAATVAPENATSKNVTWTTSDEKVATVAEDGTVTAVAPGTATITATAGDKTATCEITVKYADLKSVKVTPASSKIAYGKKVQLKAVANTPNAKIASVKWSVDKSKYATVSKSGKVTTKKAGKGKTVKVTATVTDTNRNVVKKTVNIKIMNHKVTKVTISGKSTISVKYSKKSVKLKATVKTNGKSVNNKLKWTSSNTKYATVDSKGKVTFKAAGKGKTVTITATATDGTGKKDKVRIKIKK